MTTYARAGTQYEIGLQELGEAIIKDSFRLAAKAFLLAVTPVYEAQEIQQSLIFIRGSGLETVISTFGVPLDPEDLRHTFQWKLQQLAS